MITIYANTKKYGIVEMEGSALKDGTGCFREENDGDWRITDLASGLLIQGGFKKHGDCVAWMNDKDNIKKIENARTKDKKRYHNYCMMVEKYKKEDL